MAIIERLEHLCTIGCIFRRSQQHASVSAVCARGVNSEQNERDKWIFAFLRGGSRRRRLPCIVYKRMCVCVYKREKKKKRQQ